MKELEHEIKTAVFKEYERAAVKFGKANNSNHESFAVILEELEEADFSRFKFKGVFEKFWEATKTNKKSWNDVLDMQAYAIQTACEWVQVAAMCHKAMQSKEKAT